MRAPEPEDHPRVIAYRAWRGELDPDPLTVDLAALESDQHGAATCACLTVATIAGLALLLALAALVIALGRRP